MENIYLLLFVLLVCWYLFYLRKVSEAGTRQAQQYCKKANLQFISVARRSSKLRFNKKLGIYWLSYFDFEFSGDGESQYQGVMILSGLKLTDLIVPPYRV